MMHAIHYPLNFLILLPYLFLYRLCLPFTWFKMSCMQTKHWMDFACSNSSFTMQSATCFTFNILASKLPTKVLRSPKEQIHFCYSFILGRLSGTVKRDLENYAYHFGHWFLAFRIRSCLLISHGFLIFKVRNDLLTDWIHLIWNCKIRSCTEVRISGLSPLQVCC